MIGIIGSGNVGANMAFFIAEKLVDNVLLFDIQEGLVAGKSLDMMEAAPIRGYTTTIGSAESLDQILECELVFITAGSVRQPGMKREGLYTINLEIMEELAGKFNKYEGIVVIVTEPVDMLTRRFIKASGMDYSRVMGLGCILDSTRLRFMIATELNVSMENVSALVIGRHADPMIPLEKYCCVSGVPVSMFMDEEKLLSLFEETRGAGALIVDMAQRASSFYGPSAVAAELAETVFRNSRRILSVSHMLTGQYGIEDVCLSLPAVIGKDGIVRTLEPELEPSELKLLKSSAEEVRV